MEKLRKSLTRNLLLLFTIVIILPSVYTDQGAGNASSGFSIAQATEPGSLFLLGSGLVGLGSLARWYRKRQRSADKH